MEAVSPPPSFERGDWRFEVNVAPLWGSDRIDALASERKICKVPDMFCGDAWFRAFHADSSTLIELSTADAFQCCAWDPPPPTPLQPPHMDANADKGPLLGDVRCQFAGEWRPHKDNPDVKEIEVTSDWTCTTPYWGSVYRSAAGITKGDSAVLVEGSEEATDDGLPMELLQRRDEIHWYQEVRFWEDELEDNGLCRVSVRVRVMPTFWFALLLCEMRVDGVLIREVGTRLFCSFGSDRVLREWTWKEASFEVLTSRGVDMKNNPYISQQEVGARLLGQGDVQRQLRHALRLGAGAPFAQVTPPPETQGEDASAADSASGAGCTSRGTPDECR